MQADLEQHRTELTGYCYRMLGSAFEAEDAVQETMIRAWRGQDRFEGRSALRSWMYRIATNVCLDSLAGRKRRALPMDFGPAGTADAAIGASLPEATWLQPIPDAQVVREDADPAAVSEARESIRLAFVAALQHLPPRQRAVLILREVLRWSAIEVAELLDTTVVSVNSALQRARATLAETELTDGDAFAPLDQDQAQLLEQYVDAFQRYDMNSLTSLLHSDATQSMPPYAMWLRGRADVLDFWQGTGAACRGSRLIQTIANGRPAFGQYRPRPDGSGFDPWALQVLDVSDGKLVNFTFFLDTAAIFPRFGLPPALESDVAAEYSVSLDALDRQDGVQADQAQQLTQLGGRSS
jgi:RNA polymerase sigma-70 factor (ECF subfamily)